jgi:hypothetical protein
VSLEPPVSQFLQSVDSGCGREIPNPRLGFLIKLIRPASLLRFVEPIFGYSDSSVVFGPGFNPCSDWWTSLYWGQV